MLKFLLIIYLFVFPATAYGTLAGGRPNAFSGDKMLLPELSTLQMLFGLQTVLISEFFGLTKNQASIIATTILFFLREK